MTRRLILAALALFAFLALESCGVNRVAGPTSDARSFGATAFKIDHNKHKNPPAAEAPAPIATEQPIDQGGDGTEQPVERSH